LAYYRIFKNEFAVLQSRYDTLAWTQDIDRKILVVITIVYCLFLTWAVINLHPPSLVIAGFLFFYIF
jgi:hypothetical protein